MSFIAWVPSACGYALQKPATARHVLQLCLILDCFVSLSRIMQVGAWYNYARLQKVHIQAKL